MNLTLVRVCVRAYPNTGFSPRLALGITYMRTPSSRETRVKVYQLCGPHEAYSISCAHADMDTSRVDSDIYSSYPQPPAGAGISQCTYELFVRLRRM